MERTLMESLSLARRPVAVVLADQVPAGVAAYSGHAPAGCTFWQEAEERVFATTAADHGLCAVGLHTHNLGFTPAAEAELGQALKVFAELGYVRNEDIALIPVLPVRPKVIVYGPLGETPAAPDVVLLFVKASQTLILVEAAQQVEGNFAPLLGRPACAIVPQAKNSGRTALSLGCCGARAYLDALTDDVALYALPGNNLAAYVERIAALAKANQVLSTFHRLRREDVAAGASPTIEESLARLS